MTCIFDIETIPDFHLLKEMYGYEGEPLEIARSAFNAQKEKSGSEFLPLCFHRIISISSVLCDEYGHFHKVGHYGQKLLDNITENTESTQNQKNVFLSKTFLDELEQTLLRDFWKFFNTNNPKLVSFNGRGFDLPLLTLRAMRYNINASAFFETDEPRFNKTKWDNYRQRYSERFHTDLFECIGHFGMVRTLNLDTICKMLDIVGKYDMNGSQVYDIYLSNATTAQGTKDALMQINHYCHSDVLNTYWLYLKYELLKGTLLESDYYSLLQEFCDKIPKDMPYSSVFIEKIKSHLENTQQ